MLTLTDTQETAFELTKDQTTAYDKIEKFLEDTDRRSFILDGPAGSGKTTLLHRLKNILGDRVVICAQTNKAVGVLREKGFDQATTLDRVLNKSIYAPIFRPPTPQEIEYYKEHDLPIPERIEEENYEKVPADGAGTIVCVDESSMTNEEEFTRLIAMYQKVIFVGDAFQLPPVEGVRWFQTATPDVRLYEVVRAGEGSEITALANLIRRKSPEWKKTDWTNEVTIIDRYDRSKVEQALKEGNITLAHKNVTCDTYNLRIRDLRGLILDPRFCYTPQKGDTLLSWENLKTKGILKSEIYSVEKAYPLNGGYRVQLAGVNELIAISKANLCEQKTEITVSNLNRFSFAHCITAHKSQGSEWDNVVVLAYDHAAKWPDHWNWLYTAVTRAKKHLTVIV